MATKTWLCIFHNRFHDGSSVTIVEKFEFKYFIDSKWKSPPPHTHTHGRGICSRGDAGEPSYISKMWTWVTGNMFREGRFVSLDEFRMAKALASKWNEHRAYARITAWAETPVDFSNIKVDVPAAMKAMHSLSTTIASKLRNNRVSKYEVGMVIGKGINFCIPFETEANGGREVPPFFHNGVNNV